MWTFQYISCICIIIFCNFVCNSLFRIRGQALLLDQSDRWIYSLYITQCVTYLEKELVLSCQGVQRLHLLFNTQPTVR